MNRRGIKAWRSSAISPANRLLQVLRSPCITEKSTRVEANHRQLVFKVALDTNKKEIRRAVELLFEVKVERVRVCNMQGKKRLFRQRSGRRPAWKKAYVKLLPGYKLSLSDTE